MAIPQAAAANPSRTPPSGVVRTSDLWGVARKKWGRSDSSASPSIGGRGRERLVNARFRAMASHYLFAAEFCNRAAG